jgi:hypothetical protein
MSIATVPPHQLLTRLEQIGTLLSQRADALGLIALGSCGLERERLDAFSDLDFFVVVEAAAKPRYLVDLDWLAATGPIAYAFRNTVDGYKLLYADGIFCEFAVFAPAELVQAQGSAAHVIWARPGTALPLPQAPPARSAPDLEWQLGEALTNLYVGLGRYCRGEYLSAARFIQHYAVDRVLTLVAHTTPPGAALADPFAAERRVEQRYPDLAHLLPQFVPGYAHSCAAALVLLAFLEAHWPVNPHLAAAIRARAAIAQQADPQ